MMRRNYSVRLPRDWRWLFSNSARAVGFFAGIAAEIYFGWHGQFGEMSLTVAVLGLYYAYD